MQPTRLAALLLPLLLLSACSNFRPLNDTSDAPPTLENSQEFVHYLGTKGFILRPLALSSSLITRVPSSVYRVEGGVIEVFEFESAEEAEEGVQDYQLERFGGRSSALFQRGSLLVAFHGSSSSVLLALNNTLGAAIY